MGTTHLREMHVAYEGPLVTTAWLADHLADPDIRIIETGGDRAAYANAHIPGALWVDPYADLLRSGDETSGEIITPAKFAALMSRLGVDPSTLIITYGDEGGRHATRLFWTCRCYGHERVVVVDGGREAWLREGRPGERTVTAVRPTGYPEPRERPGLRISAEEIRDRLADPRFRVLDVRKAEEHRGTDVRAARGGRIPGARHLYWSEALAGDTRLRPLPELRELYERAGVNPEATIAVYCQLGMRAAHTWFVLSQVLGYPDVRLYDGSWQDWGNREDVPVDGPALQPAGESPVLPPSASSGGTDSIPEPLH